MSKKTEWPVHPTCGKVFPPGTLTSHCPVCHETFYGDTAGNAHRRGPHGPERHCVDPSIDGKHTWTLDSWGRWHIGEQLTDEDKARIWGERK